MLNKVLYFIETIMPFFIFFYLKSVFEKKNLFDIINVKINVLTYVLGLVLNIILTI